MSTEARRERVFAALEAIHARDGVDGLTMVAIAAEARMSKRTLYSLFEDREELLHQYMEWVRADYVRPLSDDEKDYPLCNRLHLLLAPAETGGRGLPMDLLRRVIVKPPQQPDCLHARIQDHIERNRALVKAELDRAVVRGEAEISDTREAALLLETMVRPSILEPLVGISGVPSVAQLRSRFDLGLTIFLRGVGAAPDETAH